MHFVTLILASLLVQTQALPSPPNTLSEISSNEALPLPIPANQVRGVSPNPAQMATKQLDRRQWGFGGCGGQTSRWPEQQAVFFPPRPRRVDVNMSQSQHGARGFVARFGTGEELEVEVTCPLWNAATGTFGTVVTGWNRTDRARRIIVIVEVHPGRGFAGPIQEFRHNLDMPWGLHYGQTICMISTFGPNHFIQMYLWLDF